MIGYKLQGNLDNVDLMYDDIEASIAPDAVLELLPEDCATEPFVRSAPPVLPPWLRFHLKPPEDKSHKFKILDAISSVHVSFGVDTFVAERAVELLAPHLGDECEFIKAPIAGAPQTYYAMWVRHVLDAVDFRLCQLKEVTYYEKAGKHPFRLRSYEFKQDVVGERYLFRLIGHNLTDDSLHDFATDRFLGLVKRLGITGFRFYKSGLSVPPIVPVPE
ncbi:MAG: hypothetical protein F9K47_15105 [Burkholderiales bacterium]|nr:MAG: hypothetical protein F9K47_15105 [Burkholderiales bacterium]